MIWQLNNNKEYEIDSFNFTVGKVENDGESTFKDNKRIFITIPHGIDIDINQLNQEINFNFNGTLTFITRFGSLIYENYIFDELSLQVTDSSFDLTANFIYKQE